jgi:hypothetical protein
MKNIYLIWIRLACLTFVNVGKLDDVVRTREVTQNLLGENSILLSIVICQSKIMHMDVYCLQKIKKEKVIVWSFFLNSIKFGQNFRYR